MPTVTEVDLLVQLVVVQVVLDHQDLQTLHTQQQQLLEEVRGEVYTVVPTAVDHPVPAEVNAVDRVVLVLQVPLALWSQQLLPREVVHEAGQCHLVIETKFTACITVMENQRKLSALDSYLKV